MNNVLFPRWKRDTWETTAAKAFSKKNGEGKVKGPGDFYHKVGKSKDVTNASFLESKQCKDYEDGKEAQVSVCAQTCTRAAMLWQAGADVSGTVPRRPRVLVQCCHGPCLFSPPWRGP